MVEAAVAAEVKVKTDALGGVEGKRGEVGPGVAAVLGVVGVDGAVQALAEFGEVAYGIGQCLGLSVVAVVVKVFADTVEVGVEGEQFVTVATFDDAFFYVKAVERADVAGKFTAGFVVFAFEEDEGGEFGALVFEAEGIAVFVCCGRDDGGWLGQMEVFKDIARDERRVARGDAQALVGDVGGEEALRVAVGGVKAVFLHEGGEVALRVVVGEVIAAKGADEVVQRHVQMAAVGGFAFAVAAQAEGILCAVVGEVLFAAFVPVLCAQGEGVARAAADFDAVVVTVGADAVAAEVRDDDGGVDGLLGCEGIGQRFRGGGAGRCRAGGGQGILFADVVGEVAQGGDAVFAQAAVVVRAGAVRAEFFCVVQGDAVKRAGRACAGVGGAVVVQAVLLNAAFFGALDGGAAGVFLEVFVDGVGCREHTAGVWWWQRSQF